MWPTQVEGVSVGRHHSKLDTNCRDNNTLENLSVFDEQIRINIRTSVVLMSGMMSHFHFQASQINLPRSVVDSFEDVSPADYGIPNDCVLQWLRGKDVTEIAHQYTVPRVM